ncbi:HpaA family protein [Helicobacter ailurogastricus]|uniref:HpaA family protein n=1 Tax=Helicobacter ailurogastricus TaxID=1578720 RepID=UPI000CF05821|nr:HpaA family protein [Helicobacter ailurogastricus]
MQLKTWLCGVGLAAVLAGCGPDIIVTNNVPLRLAYKSQTAKAPATHKQIMILKPLFQYSDNIVKEYENRFKKQLVLKIQTLLENQGYKATILDVSDKNDLTFSQKRDNYLGVELSGEIVLRPDPKTTEQKKSSPGLIFSTGMDVTRGALLAMGYIKVVFIEPESGEAVDSFMVDLSEIDVREPFVRSSRSEHTGGLLSSLYKGKDDSNDAVKKALNTIFSAVLAKIDAKMTQEKIQAYAKDIADLKAQRKY